MHLRTKVTVILLFIFFVILKTEFYLNARSPYTYILAYIYLYIVQCTYNHLNVLLNYLKLTICWQLVKIQPHYQFTVLSVRELVIPHRNGSFIHPSRPHLIKIRSRRMKLVERLNKKLFQAHGASQKYTSTHTHTLSTICL